MEEHIDNTVENPRVTKPEVMRALDTGLKFVFTPDKELMGMLGWVTLLGFLVSVVVMPMGDVMGTVVSAPLLALVQLPPSVWAVRKTLTGEGGTKFFGWYSKDVTWRVFWAGILLLLIMAVPIICLVGALNGFAGDNLPQMSPGRLVIICVMALAIFYLFTRFSFVSAFTVDTGEVDMIGAFRETAGLFWRIVGLTLLISLIFLFVLFIVVFIIILLGKGFNVIFPGMLVGDVVVSALNTTAQTWMMIGVSVALASFYKEKKMLEG